MAGLAAAALAQAPRAELTGFAVLPPDTFAAGPPSGRFLSPVARGTGFARQPVQGFSAIRPDRGRPGWWLVLCDNGYGSKANSADFLLRIYSVKPDWRSGAGGGGTVEIGRMIQLSDPDRRVPFRLVREDTPERWLTGGDFDPESFVEAPDGTLLVAYAPDRYLAIERDGSAGRDARVKRVLAFRLGAPGTSAEPLLVADLLDIADAHNLSGIGPVFTFPFITPEAVWPEDARTLVLVNDNNYPGGGGREPVGSRDASEFIRLRLPQSLPR